MNLFQNFSTLSERAKLTLILLVALAARLLGINTRPIWHDEAFAVLFSEKGPAAMLQGTRPPRVRMVSGPLPLPQLKIEFQNELVTIYRVVSP